MKLDPILLFQENRVRRAYPGGAGIEQLHGRAPMDGFYPEEWIGSLVEANNTGMEPIELEGISRTDQGALFPDLLQMAPDYYLGEEHFKELGLQTGFLVKYLDSAVRLPLQAHPNREFARKMLNSPWGKLECYYILDVRENISPYILLGFQRPKNKEQWRKMLLNQDLNAIQSCFDRIPVAKGEFWMIPAGLPHAIGEGITMIEVMEPSDWVVRCEFEPVKGKVFPPEARYMGCEIDDVLDVFDYSQYSIRQIVDRCKLQPEIIRRTDTVQHRRLVSASQTDCFEVQSIVIHGSMRYAAINRFFVGIISGGSGRIFVDDSIREVKKGDAFFIAAAVTDIKFESAGSNSDTMELCIVLPKSYT